MELTYSYPSSELVSDAVIRLGQYFYRTKEFEVAASIFGKFQEGNSEHELAPKALFLSGQCFMKGAEERKQKIGGEYDPKAKQWLAEATERLGELIRTYDDKDLRAESMYWQATCFLKLQDMKGAYMALKKLTWDYPESKWAKFARGQLVQHANVFERYAED